MKKLLSVLLCAAVIFSSAVISFASETGTTETTASVSTAAEAIPAKVSGLKTEKSGSGSITLCWSPVSGADGYLIFAKAENAGKYEKIANIKENRAVVQELQSASVYCFKVQAYRETENGKPAYGSLSNELKAVTAPAKVKKIVTRSISKNSITLLWSASAGATHYEISLFSSKDNKFMVYGVVENKTVFEIADLLPGRIYTFRIRPITVYGGQNAFGEYSDNYSEFTDKDGTVYTKSQAAVRYNEAINTLKQTKDCSAAYKKAVSTQVLDCSYRSLTSTCKNIMKLFEGQLQKNFQFKDGKADGYTMNSLIEPYSQPAALKGNDIFSFSYKKDENFTYYSIKLKSESAKYADKKTAAPSSGKTVMSTVALENQRIAPVKLKSATQVFDGIQIKLKLSNDGTRKSLAFTNPVLVKANCKVSTVNFSVNVIYEINESYAFKIPG